MSYFTAVPALQIGQPAFPAFASRFETQPSRHLEINCQPELVFPFSSPRMEGMVALDTPKQLPRDTRLSEHQVEADRALSLP